MSRRYNVDSLPDSDDIDTCGYILQTYDSCFLVCFTVTHSGGKVSKSIGKECFR